MTTVVLPTLAVAASWFLFGLVILGCGFVTRIALVSGAEARLPRAADLWIGLGALVLYLLVWNEFAGVTWYSWLVPGAGRCRRSRTRCGTAARPELRRPALVADRPRCARSRAAPANQALGPAQD